MCPSRSLPLHRPRQSALRYPAVVANRSPIHSVQRGPSLIHEPLPLRPTRSIGSTPITHLIRGTQIPIAHAAPPSCPSRGFLPWRFADAGPVCAAPPSWGRHPKTFTNSEVSLLARHVRCTHKSRRRRAPQHVRLVPKQASTGGVGFHVAGRATVRRRLAANLRLVWRPDLAAGSGSDLEGAIRYGGGRWRGMPLAPGIVVYADAARRQLPK